MPESLCFPVWNFAHCADPYMASIRHIRKTCANNPEREAVLIGSVFRLAHAAGQAGGQAVGQPPDGHLLEAASA